MYLAQPGAALGMSEEENGDSPMIDTRASTIVRRFVPKVVVKRFEERKRFEKNREEIKSVTGVVAFFDISGFSTLANKLEQVEKGRRLRKKQISNRYSSAATYSTAALGTGAEKLAEGLNETLQMLVNIILESGGDIIKFAGDALIVVWEGLKEEIPVLTAVVCDCALRCTEVTLSSASALHLHTGIGCGQILKCHVGGGLDRWEFSIAGDANTQAASAEAASEKDQVVVSDVAFAQLLRLERQRAIDMVFSRVQKRKYLSYVEVLELNLNTKCQQVTFPPKIDLVEYANLPMSRNVLDLAKAYIPRPVMQMIESELATNVDELRKVSVIFFKLTETVCVPITERLDIELEEEEEEPDQEQSSAGSSTPPSDGKEESKLLACSDDDEEASQALAHGSGNNNSNKNNNDNNNNNKKKKRKKQKQQQNRNHQNYSNSATENRETKDGDFHETQDGDDGTSPRTLSNDHKNSTNSNGKSRGSSSGQGNGKNQCESYFGGICIDETDSDSEDPAVEMKRLQDKKKHDDFLKSIQHRVRAVQEAAYSQYGTLRQFIIDDKGFVAIVVIGLPPHFFEDNAARAVKVASHLIHTQRIKATVGICTGTVFCGAIGSDYRAEYSVTGECINLAARLMGKALPNTALCDETTTNEARTNPWIKFQAISPLNVKGYADAVPAFRPDLEALALSNPVQRNSATNVVNRLRSRESNYFGGNSEFTAIGQEGTKADICKSIFLNDSKPAKAVFVEGPPGSGKTHITHWAVSICSEVVKNIFYSVADANESKTPFYAWRPILIEILKLDQMDIEDSDEPDEATLAAIRATANALSNSKSAVSNGSGALGLSQIPPVPSSSEPSAKRHSLRGLLKGSYKPSAKSPTSESASPSSSSGPFSQSSQDLSSSGAFFDDGEVSSSLNAASSVSINTGVGSAAPNGSSSSSSSSAAAAAAAASSTSSSSSPPASSSSHSISAGPKNSASPTSASLSSSSSTTTPSSTSASGNNTTAPLRRTSSRNPLSRSKPTGDKSSKGEKNERRRLSSKSFGGNFLLGASLRSRSLHGEEAASELGNINQGNAEDLYLGRRDSNQSMGSLGVGPARNSMPTDANVLKSSSSSSVELPIPRFSDGQHKPSSSSSYASSTSVENLWHQSESSHQQQGKKEGPLAKISKLSNVLTRSLSMGSGAAPGTPSNSTRPVATRRSKTHNPQSESSQESNKNVNSSEMDGPSSSNVDHRNTRPEQLVVPHGTSAADDGVVDTHNTSPSSTHSSPISETMQTIQYRPNQTPTSISCGNLEAFIDKAAPPPPPTPSGAPSIGSPVMSAKKRIRNGSTATGSSSVFPQPSSSVEGRFLQVSKQSGDQHIAEQSFMIRKLRENGRLKHRRLSSLGQILPGFFFPPNPDAAAYQAERNRVGSDLSEGVFNTFKPSHLLSRLGEIPGSPHSNMSNRKRPPDTPEEDNWGEYPYNSAATGPESYNGLMLNPNHSRRYSSPSAGKDKSQEKEDLMELMLALLDETGKLGSTLIVIDSAQDMDEDSWELLRRAILAGKVEFEDKYDKTLAYAGSGSSSASNVTETVQEVRLSGPRVRFLITFRPSPHPETASPAWMQLLELCSSERKRTSSTASLDGHLEEELAQSADALARSRRPEWCILSPLRSFSLRECGSFLSVHRGIGIGSDLIKFLFQATDGNPGYLLNLFNGLVEQQLVQVDPITGVAQVLEGLNNMPSENILLLSLPGHTVADVYRRYDSQSKNVQFLLKLASAIGKLVPTALLFYLYSKKAQLLSHNASFAATNNNNGLGAAGGSAENINESNSNNSSSNASEKEPVHRGGLEDIILNPFDESQTRSASSSEQQRGEDESDETDSTNRRESGSSTGGTLSPLNSASSNGAAVSSKNTGSQHKLGHAVSSSSNSNSSNTGGSRIFHRGSFPSWKRSSKRFSTNSSREVNVQEIIVPELDTEALREEFYQALEELKRHNFISEQAASDNTGPGGPNIIFKEDNDRCVIYNMMLNTDKRLIHQHILEWHEEHKENQKGVSGFDIGMLGYHAMLSEQYVKAFSYFESGIRDSIQNLDRESVECFAYSCKEITDTRAFIQEIEGSIKPDVRPLYVVNLFRSKTFIMLAQYYIMLQSWEEAKAFLRLAEQSSTYATHALRRGGMMKRFYRSIRRSKSTGIKSPQDLLSQFSDLDDEVFLIESTKCSKQAKKLSKKLSKMDRVMKSMVEDIENAIQRI